ncbi:hypothetical protein D3C78_528270 [compost metagenome]
MAAARLALIGEGYRLVQGLEAGLAQQDRALAARRAFDHRFGGDAMGRHLRLHDVDVQGPRCQVVDVRALERHYVGDQAMLGAELSILFGGDGGAVVPAKRFQCLFDEFLGFLLGQATPGFGAFDKREGRGGEDRALVEHRLGERS